MAVHPALSDEEIGARGKQIYDRSIRAQVDLPANRGKMISIDIDSSDFEIDLVGIEAARRLRARHPRAVLFGMRIGYDVVYTLDEPLIPLKPL
jgi:hypothetical protein